MTPQDLTDALNRLTAAVQALHQQQAQHQQAAQASAPAGQAPAPAGSQPQQKPSPKANKAGPLNARLSRLQAAHKAFQRAREGWGTFRKVQGLARDGRWGQAIKAGRTWGRKLGRGMGFKGGKAGGVAAAGRVGGVVAGVTVLVEAFRKFKQHIEQTTDALVAAQQRLGEVSPSMAAVMARRQMQEIFRDQRKGEALAESAQQLVAAEQRRKDAMLPMEVAMDTFWNRVYAAGNDFLAGFAKAADKFFGLDEKEQAKRDLADQVQAEVNLELAKREKARKRMEDLRKQADAQKPRPWWFER